MSTARSPYFTRLRSTTAATKLSSGDVLPSRSDKLKKENVPRKKAKHEHQVDVSKLETTSICHSEETKENFKTNQHVKPLKKLKWAPTRWEEQLANIRKMRQSLDAPVDTMGCEKCKGQDYSEKVIPFKFEWCLKYLSKCCELHFF